MSRQMILMLIRVQLLDKDLLVLKVFKTNLGSKEDKERMIFTMNSTICLEIMEKDNSQLKLRELILLLVWR